MTVKLLVDMNLSPDWVRVLMTHGWPAVHWSDIGGPGASDRAIMEWAASHDYVVFTHDLDFGTILALSHAEGPSVLQVRAQMYSRIISEGASLLLLSITKLICRVELCWWWMRAGVEYGSCRSDP